jgi:peptidylprolyl isomerase
MGKVIALIIIVAIVVVLYMRSNTNKEEAVKNKLAGMDFLKDNRAAEGVIETTSGLQYLVLNKGEGTAHPSSSDKVRVHYHGTLLDGTVFDSSVDRNQPISFGLSQVIKGWTEGVQLMVVGDKFRFFIPSDLAYGDRSAGKITPGSTLIFDVELLGINQ